ncbi:MAG: sigma-54 dependent transcriptional regulator, partial [Burkholderiaceae bacterium]
SNILCIDDEPSVGVVLEHHLTEIGHHPVLATSVDEGLKAVREQSFDLIISDYRMPNATGLDLLELLRAQGYEIPVIIMTGYSSIEHAVLSIRHGAVDYLTKPLRQEALRIAVNNAIEVARLRRENEAYRREITSLRGQRTIVGESPALREVMDTIAMVAPTRATVLLEGESGTGKELFARALHEQSPRKDEPFVTVNCAALPEGLVESTLFGHERGAFTGATQRQAGAFERAHRGTLLLDEISEMRLDLQAKLLRAIQEQEFERVGGSQPVRVDVRIVATTNRDLLAEVEAGRFRRDLYYRLAVVPVKTPALRERTGDLPRLVEHFVAVTSAELGVRAPVVRPEALAALERRSWPGNIRELANAVERAVLLSRGNPLGAEAFGTPGGVAPAAATAAAPTVLPTSSEAPAAAAPAGELPLNLRDLERIAIERALAATGGHRTRAADLLGISERTLRNKLNGPPEAAA